MADKVYDGHIGTRQSPWLIVGASTILYTCVLAGCLSRSLEPRKSVKAISAAHSLCTTLVSTYVLRSIPWHITKDNDPYAEKRADPDASNPIIAGKSVIGNAITSYETGYLIYDTGALLYLSHQRNRSAGLAGAFKTLAKRDSPVFLAHHISLVAALGYLQLYIAEAREKGVWVIVAMLLMNASNPLLHFRWWLKKTHGKVPILVDVSNAAVFAATRFGVIAWLLKKHGDFHHVSAVRAFQGLRSECRSGTALLTAVNALWWLGLLRGIAVKINQQAQ